MTDCKICNSVSETLKNDTSTLKLAQFPSQNLNSNPDPKPNLSPNLIGCSD